MEVIQEFSENRYYLNALSLAAKLELQLPQVQHFTLFSQHIQHIRTTETPDSCLTEPLSSLFFRFHLIHINSLHIQLALNEMEEYDRLPVKNSDYRRKIAKSIINKYIRSGARFELPIHPQSRSSMLTLFKDKGPIAALFSSIKQQLQFHLRLSCFESFRNSHYYTRLLSFRLYGQTPVSTASFEFLRVLGEGGFGKVFAVRKNDTRAVYACKTLNKQKVLENQREKLIMNERNILSVIQHPFIVCMKYAFQDAVALHLVLDIMTGGELQFHLNRIGMNEKGKMVEATKPVDENINNANNHNNNNNDTVPNIIPSIHTTTSRVTVPRKTTSRSALKMLRGGFEEEIVRFWAAGLVLAIEYLHSKSIVYRDLKPENVMLDIDGHIRLTDLGLSCFKRANEALTRNCGTRSYMAPEQYCSPYGYGKPVDWFSLGVTILTLLTGWNPYAQRQPRPDREKQRKESLINSSLLKRTSLANLLFGRDNDNPLEDSVKDASLPNNGLDEEQQRAKAESKKESALRAYEEVMDEYAFCWEEFEKHWPAHSPVSVEAKDLISRLVEVVPEKRLGSVAGAGEIKQHAWFKSMDWNKLYHRHITPPYKPHTDFVNADFLESTQIGIAATSQHSKRSKLTADPLFNKFQGFEFVHPTIFQEEVCQTIHDKLTLIYGEERRSKQRNR